VEVLDPGCKPLLTFQETLTTMSSVWSRASTLVVPTMTTLSTTQKVAVVGFGMAGVVFVVVARSVRRKRPDGLGEVGAARVRRQRLGQGTDAILHRRGATPTYNWAELQKQSVSDQDSVISSATLVDGTSLTPQQWGLMGMEALETVIGYWEDALGAYHPSDNNLALTTAEEAEFRVKVEDILYLAYQLQEQSEMLFIDQGSILNKARRGTVLEISEDNEESSRRDRTKSILSVSTVDEVSFVSAQDTVADMRDFDDLNDVLVDIDKLPLYQSALDLYETRGIPYRVMRTQFFSCTSDMDYLAKLHCVRLSFKDLMSRNDVRQWWIDSGRDILSQLLVRMDKDTKEFLASYDDLLEFLSEEDNMAIMEEELQSRNVKCINFYDICLDYILIDAFEDLVSPPGSVLAVMRNRWLSNGFKESALQTAVWSVFQAKRRLLRYPNGFKSRFYNVSESMMPPLAWAFFGPDQAQKDLVTDFKDQVNGFLADIFDFQVVDYSSCTALADSIMGRARDMAERISSRLADDIAATGS